MKKIKAFAVALMLFAGLIGLSGCNDKGGGTWREGENIIFDAEYVGDVTVKRAYAQVNFDRREIIGSRDILLPYKHTAKADIIRQMKVEIWSDPAGPERRIKVTIRYPKFKECISDYVRSPHVICEVK